MSKFTERLWRDLLREHGADLTQMNPLAPSAHCWRARPRMLAGTSLGAAGLATAAALIFGAASSSPAFAVTQNHDGTYTVQIRQGPRSAPPTARCTGWTCARWSSRSPGVAAEPGRSRCRRTQRTSCVHASWRPRFEPRRESIRAGSPSERRS